MKQLTRNYYIRILLTTVVIIAANIWKNTSIELPIYAEYLSYLLFMGLVPYAVWRYDKKKKEADALTDSEIKFARLFTETKLKMTLVHLPSIVCAILFLLQPTESTLFASIAALLCFVVFGKPDNIEKR